MTSPLAELSPATDFIHRHIGPSDADIAAMLEVVGAGSLTELIDIGVPDTIRTETGLGLGEPLTEHEVLEEMRRLAAKNQVYTSLIGQGYYGTYLPPVIQRNLLENPGWYTAYTPYQPEISQGTLQVIFEFQTLIAQLTEMEVANASMYDEPSATAEAAVAVTKGTSWAQ